MNQTQSALRKQSLEFATRPQFTLNPTGEAPLAGLLEFSTDLPSYAVIYVSDGERNWRIPTPDTFAEDHRHIILGMRAERSHTIQISVRSADGDWVEWADTISFKTAPLPANIPPIEVAISNPEKMEPGYTFFGIRKSSKMGAKNYGVMVALDEVGEIVWYKDTGHTIGDVKRLQNGNILYLTFDHRAIEMDMLGTIVNQWTAVYRWPDLHTGEETLIPVEAEAFHHEIFEMENGHFLVLSVETRELENYPTDPADTNAQTETATVVGDVVVEFTRTGEVVNQWKLLDILDPYRVGYDSLSGYWAEKGIPNSKDWSHANSVVHDPADDTLILSLRHQDAVIKFKRDTGELVWIIGPSEGWNDPWQQYVLSPEDGVEWQYHQHNANLTERGTVLVFDNGNHRAWPPAAKMPATENYSRVVEFDVSNDSRRVAQVWSYGGPGDEAHFCPFICGAYQLPETGNVLGTFGGRLTNVDGEPSDKPFEDLGSIRIVEVTYGEQPEKVFEIFIDETEDGRGWDVYRSDRFPSLYG